MSDRTHQYRQLGRRDPAMTVQLFGVDAGGTGDEFDSLRFFAYTSRDGYDSWQRHERRRV